MPRTRLIFNVEGTVPVVGPDPRAFCEAAWVTYADYTWSAARAYCNDTAVALADYEAGEVGSGLLGAVRLSLDVLDLDTLDVKRGNMTLALRDANFFAENGEITYVTDKDFNRMLWTLIVLAVVVVFSLHNIGMFATKRVEGVD